jgi:transcriptional regulator with XRE-family HTH domain
MKERPLMSSYGVVLRKLRELNKQPLKQAAKAIGRSAGWLSEIENDRGAARIGLEEFERIVAAYNGQGYRKQFGIWVAQAHKPQAKSEIVFDGAILRYLREKSNLRLKEAAKTVGLSGPHLCNLEKGRRSISLELRDALMKVYGYSPASFKNFATEDKRAKNIPVRYKLDLLIRQLGEADIERIFALALHAQVPNQSNK